MASEHDNMQLFASYPEHNLRHPGSTYMATSHIMNHKRRKGNYAPQTCHRPNNSTTTTSHNYDINDINHFRLPIKKYSSSCYNKSNKFTLALLFLLSLLLKAQISQSFILDGSQSSFAQFRKWYTGLNGSLELEFKTEQPNGLVLYTDDGGTYDFFELKLVEGALRLRYNLGGGAQIITVGRDLHDGHWHKVQVSNI